MTVSEVVHDRGKHYLKVDGKPFLFNAVQSWFPPDDDFKPYVEGSARLGYKVFSFWLYWSRLEIENGKYDFTVIDRVIDLACENDIRLDIVWGGSMLCDHLDVRWVPSWIYENPEYRCLSYKRPISNGKTLRNISEGKIRYLSKDVKGRISKLWKNKKL